MSQEHYVTIFDSNFLPQGLALHRSLRERDPDAVLWVICADAALPAALSRIDAPGLRVIPLDEAENERLLAVKPNRTQREYCWTLASFSYDAVFAKAPEAKRVTYVDADIFFFSSPAPLFEELERKNRSVLITEHNFDPPFDKSEIVGRFCVQFLTMDRSAAATAVRSWWQDRVIEWCYDRRESGRFGDQKYLDLWPELFPDTVAILERNELALAPWNFVGNASRFGTEYDPVFLHFHSFRLVAPERARYIEEGYPIPRGFKRLYKKYIEAVGAACDSIAAAGLPVPALPVRRTAWDDLKDAVRRLRDLHERYATVPRKSP